MRWRTAADKRASRPEGNGASQRGRVRAGRRAAHRRRARPGLHRRGPRRARARRRSTHAGTPRATRRAAARWRARRVPPSDDWQSAASPSSSAAINWFDRLANRCIEVCERGGGVAACARRGGDDRDACGVWGVRTPRSEEHRSDRTGGLAARRIARRCVAPNRGALLPSVRHAAPRGDPGRSGNIAAGRHCTAGRDGPRGARRRAHPPDRRTRAGRAADGGRPRRCARRRAGAPRRWWGHRLPVRAERRSVPGQAGGPAVAVPARARLDDGLPAVRPEARRAVDVRRDAAERPRARRLHAGQRLLRAHPRTCTRSSRAVRCRGSTMPRTAIPMVCAARPPSCASRSRIPGRRRIP